MEENFLVWRAKSGYTRAFLPAELAK